MQVDIPSLTGKRKQLGSDQNAVWFIWKDIMEEVILTAEDIPRVGMFNPSWILEWPGEIFKHNYVFAQPPEYYQF